MSEIDLKPFCYSGNDRPYLKEPFSRGDFTYATNGHIIVRVARRPGVPEVESAPNAEKVMPSQEGIAFSPLRHFWLPTASLDTCPACAGRGFEHDCPGCECVCDACDGNREIEELVSVAIRGSMFDARYLRLLLTLPGIEIPVTLTTAMTPMPFKFIDGTGGLMPMIRKQENHVDAVENAV